MSGGPRVLPLWRSILFVPVLNERFLAGAAARGADCIQLDLEDAIPPERKMETRARLAGAAEGLAAQGCDIIVRINRPLRMAMRDLEAAVGQAVKAVTLPKAEGAGHVRLIAETLGELERERGLPVGHTGIVPMIETAGALSQMNEIAAADPRVIGIIVGAEDLALSMGMSVDRTALHVPNVMAVAAARAAGCLPLGFVGSVAGFSDLDVYAETIREARALGFAGAFAIHPAQVPILNDGFAPTADEIAHARALVAAFESALAEGRGAASFQGQMIDLPVVERARAILASAARLNERGTA